MITEFRKIVFSREEMIKAILEYNRHSTSKLPVGDIIAIRPGSQLEPELNLEIHDATDGKTEKISLKAGYLAAAMLRHCIQCKIPVPRQATKQIEVFGESIALSLTLNASPKQVYDVEI